VPKISKDSASQVVSIEGMVESHSDAIGEYEVAFDTYDHDVDLTPLFKGLPDDRCQCAHWGLVVKGKLGYRYADHEETIEAGEAYYAPPGHTRILYAGSEVIEFSPTEDLKKTMEVVTRNMEEMRRAA
jgi:hypothetical protein